MNNTINPVTTPKSALERLQQATSKRAAKATPGPWTYREDDDGREFPVAMLADGHSPYGIFTERGEPDLTMQTPNGEHIAHMNPATASAYAEIVERLTAALEFYATYSPRFHPDGIYEVHVAPGEGGEVKFGTQARQALADAESIAARALGDET